MQTIASPRPRTHCMRASPRPRRRLAHGRDDEDSKSTESSSESDKETDEQGINLTCIIIAISIEKIIFGGLPLESVQAKVLADSNLAVQYSIVIP